MRLHGVLVMHPETLQWWDASSSSAWLPPRLKASSRTCGRAKTWSEKKKHALALRTSLSWLAPLIFFFVLYLCACSFEVTVTSDSLSPFMSLRGLFSTNQRLSLSLF